MEKIKVLWWSIMMTLMSTVTVSAFAEDVILNPGTLVGSVSVTGHQINSISIVALDTDGVYSAAVTESVPAGADSIGYTLTVEGGRDYYVVASATVVADNSTKAVLPVAGPVTVPIFENPGDEATLDMSMAPAIVSGTISTKTDSGSIIENYSVDMVITVPELGTAFVNRTIGSMLSAPGIPGVDYTMLVAPGLTYGWSVNAYIDGIMYQSSSNSVTAPAAGSTLDKDFVVDVTAATISGVSTIQGITLNSTNIYGYAMSPLRSNSLLVNDVTTGAYTLDADAGTWNVRSSYYYNLPGDLSHLGGSLILDYLTVPNLTNGENRTGVDMIITPGFIPGTLTLEGANTDFSSAELKALSSDGSISSSYVDTDTGRFMFVCSPGDWNYGYSHTLNFDYPSDPDASLRSTAYVVNSGSGIQTVAAGQTTDGVNITYGTATIRYYYYVDGGGQLKSPSLTARRTGYPYSTASGSGSSVLTTEGQAMVTVLLPGEYKIEAFGYVNGSNTEFGNTTIEVDSGDIIVIGGTERPTIKVTNPEVVCGETVTVVGKATDDEGIASITINGENVSFTSTGNPDDPNEVAFSYELALPVIGENAVEVVATDVDGTDPIPLSLTVVREECNGTCDYELNVEDFDIFVFGDASNIIHNSGNLAAGGNVTLSDFGLNQIAARAVGLVAGHNLTLGGSGFVEGDVYYGGLANIDPSVTISGDIYPDTEVCFNEDDLKTCSDFNSLVTPNGAVEANACWLNLTGTDAGLNIFKLSTPPQVNSPCGMNLNIPAGSAAVINVPGVAPEVGDLAINIYTAGESDIIWNFYEATTVHISNTRFPGTIFAPYAEVVLTNCHVDGAIVANALTSYDFSGEVDNARFAHWEPLCADMNDSCSDLVKNQDESDVDCGGWCGATCELGMACTANSDCASNNCSDGVCAEAPVAGCTEATAIDIGARGVAVTVPNNACIMIRDGIPTWWNSSSIRLDTTGVCDGAVPFSWTNTCAEGSGADSFTGVWQQRTLTPVSKNCATLIDLQGSGGNIGLRWY